MAQLVNKHHFDTPSLTSKGWDKLTAACREVTPKEGEEVSEYAARLVNLDGKVWLSHLAQVLNGLGWEVRTESEKRVLRAKGGANGR